MVHNQDKIEERFPDLILLKSWEGRRKKRELQVSCEKKVGELEKKVNLQCTELLLILGLEKGKILESVKRILKEKNTVIVFIEENLQTVFDFLEADTSSIWYEEPKCCVKYVFGDFLQALEEIVKEFPKERIHVYLSKKYEKKWNFDEILLHIRRKATLSSSLSQEILYYPLLVENLLSNFKVLSRCFYADGLKDCFKNIPAVLCGAGPSLDQHISELKQMENRALIIAGGSTITALLKKGITPHLGFALDPNPEEKERLCDIYDFRFPLLFGARLHQGILENYHGPKGYLKTGAGGALEQALEAFLGLDREPLLKDIGEEGLSVTALCLSAAYHMGCRPIVLCGVDLSFIEDRRYAQGVIKDPTVQNQAYYSCSEERVFAKNREGNEVLTCVKWLMEQKVIEDFAKAHPQVEFLEVGSEGLGFPCLKKTSLKDLALSFPTLEDIASLVDAKIEACMSFSQHADEIDKFFEKILVSLKNSELLLKKIEIKKKESKKQNEDDNEDALVTLYTMDLEEEMAYTVFLKSLKEHDENISEDELRKLVERYIKVFSSLLQKIEKEILV